MKKLLAVILAGADAIVLLPGELYIVGDTPVVKGVCVADNQAGSSDFNSKDPATKGIRCLFELNEWLEFVLDTDGTDSLKVFAYKHDKAVAMMAAKFVTYGSISDKSDDELAPMMKSF